MPDNYDDYTKEELIRLIRERDRKPAFGLVWERDQIDHDRSVNDDFVALPALSRTFGLALGVIFIRHRALLGISRRHSVLRCREAETDRRNRWRQCGLRRCCGQRGAQQWGGSSKQGKGGHCGSPLCPPRFLA